MLKKFYVFLLFFYELFFIHLKIVNYVKFFGFLRASLYATG